MSRLVPALIIALILLLTSPSPATAPVIFPGVVLGHQEPEPEPVVFESTAYTWTGCRTASGSWPSRGTIATDPRVIPLGTELYIEGYGSAVALDTGGDIQGQIIDLYMDSYQECIEWGRRQVEVRVIEP